MVPGQASAAVNVRLQTWRQIGDFLGKDERTAKRWETSRGMPVHRIPGGGNAAVYAFSDELQRWLEGSKPVPVGPQMKDVVAAPREADVAATRLQGRDVADRTYLWRRSVLGVAAATLTLMSVVILGTAKPSLSRRAAPDFHDVTSPSSHEVRRPSDAIDLYLQGRYEWNLRTAQSLRLALRDFTQAIVRDSSYTDAYVGLADTYNLVRQYGVMPDEEAYPKAEMAALHALALDERSAGAHAALAFVKFHWRWDVLGARKEFERAIALDPRSASAHHWYATALLDLGSYKQALSQIDAAEALNPESASVRADKALILNESGQAGAAEMTLKQLEKSDPLFLSPHAYLAIIYLQQSRLPEYLHELRTAAQLKGDDAAARIVKASEDGFRKDGGRGMLREALRMKLALYAQGRIDDYQLAMAYGQVGDNEQALKHLAAAIALHNSNALAAGAEPMLRQVNSTPVFRALFRPVLYQSKSP